MKNPPVIWDIETGPLDEKLLASRVPEFSAPGNVKDPEKIKVAIAAKREAWFAEAALSAQTGRVLIVGLWREGEVHFLEGEEEAVLKGFWRRYNDTSPAILIGWNSKRFDLPFILRRSWILGVTVPAFVIMGRYFNRRFLDAMDWWDCFQRDSEHGSSSLDAVSKAMGLGGKTGDGTKFAELYAKDRKAALDYCGHDLKLTATIAEAIGAAYFELEAEVKA